MKPIQLKPPTPQATHRKPVLIVC